VEKLIEEADKITEKAMINYMDPTDEIHGPGETES